MNETLETLVASEIEPLGLELFEMKVGGSKGRPVIDVRVEREDGERVTVDNCAAASRAIASAVPKTRSAMDVIWHRYEAVFVPTEY